MAKASINPILNKTAKSTMASLSNGHSVDDLSAQTEPSSPIRENSPLIAIIGAGVAGLRAAQMLLNEGYRTVIYEARDRYGGRVCTSDVLGKAVDLGPNWVHGTVENPIVPLTQAARASLHNFSDNCPVYEPSGALLNGKESDELQGMLWNVIDEAVEYSKANCSNIPADKSFYDYCAEKAEEIFRENSKSSKPDINGYKGVNGAAIAGEEHIKWKGAEQKKEIWLSMAEFWGSFIGTSVQKQSLKYFYLEEPIEGPNLFVASTYKPILETLARTCKEAGIIQLNTPIIAITHNDTAKGKPVSLTTASGQMVEADAVVVTAPLGCLKRDTIKFSPPLPGRIQSAISSLSYGHLEKIYISFPTAFWNSESEVDTELAPDLFQFLTPRYASKTNLGQWHMCCFSLAHLPEPYSQPTLLFYIFGDASAHVTKNFAPFDTNEGREQYVGFLEPYISRLPGYEAGKAGCVPTKLLATSWSNDPWSGYGSYSNFQVGLEDGEEDIVSLRNGMPDRRIWFAGEHTAPILGLGSISGAHWSGTGAAERVIRAFEGCNEEVPE